MLHKAVGATSAHTGSWAINQPHWPSFYLYLCFTCRICDTTARYQIFFDSVLPFASARQRHDVISRRNSVLNRMVSSAVAALKKSQSKELQCLPVISLITLWSLYLSSSHAFPIHIWNLEPWTNISYRLSLCICVFYMYLTSLNFLTLRPLVVKHLSVSGHFDL